jgi:hypothetical protein
MSALIFLALRTGPTKTNTTNKKLKKKISSGLGIGFAIGMLDFLALAKI